MGVLGLWSLLDPAGKPIPVESLENQVCTAHIAKLVLFVCCYKQVHIVCNQVLAVDISIWLNQAVKGMRDKSGHAVPHAHLVFILSSSSTFFICLFLGWTLPPGVQAPVLQDQACLCL